jgi:hypothetical protein
MPVIRSLPAPPPACSCDHGPRDRTLAALLPLWPHEIEDRSLAGQQHVCRLLAAALRRERQRGIAGHWTYDLARHGALARLLPQEQRRLAHLLRSSKRPAQSAGLSRSDGQ